MNERNRQLLKRIQYPAYIQFFIGILFWIGAGADLFGGLHVSVYILMLLLLVCNISIILSVFLLDKFYLDNLRESFVNLESLNLKLRSQRHEYLNEMQVVYGLLELGEYREAYQYLKPVYEDIAKVGKALKTAKPAVNALLQAKMEYAEKHGVVLYVEVSSDLAQLSMEQWDLCRILGNLIDNAITAVSLNEGEKSVHIYIHETENNYCLGVYNNGPIIPENKRELIFKKGYSSKKEEGHGLGLGIVLDIVTKAGGTILLESKEGKTEFEVILPKLF